MYLIETIDALNEYIENIVPLICRLSSYSHKFASKITPNYPLYEIF